MSKTVFIDMDGTLCTYADHQDKVNMTHFPPGSFLYREPVEPVINAIIDNFGNEHLAILSAVPHQTAIYEKQAWLNMYFNIEERHFIKWKEETKADFIKGYAEENKIELSDIILIDDEHKILSEVENLGVQVYHISKLLCLGKERKKMR